MAQRKPASSLAQALGWFVVLAALVLVATWALRRAEPPTAPTTGRAGAPPTPPAPAPWRGEPHASARAPDSAAAGPGEPPALDRDREPTARGAPEKPDATAAALAARREAEAAAIAARRAADEAARATTDAARSSSRPAPLDPLPEDTARLVARRLALPVQGIAATQLADTYTDARAGGARRHDAIDIMAPAGTPVLAVEDGRIAKLFFSQGGGGITVYQFDPDDAYAYYYAHLERYVDGLKEGQRVQRGQVIGYVGSTGNASPGAPHLHFAITKLGPKKEWWKGEALNPYPVLRGP